MTFNQSLNNTQMIFINQKKQKTKFNLFTIQFLKQMKKWEDKSVKLFFKQQPRGKTFQVDCSIHTNIHLLKIFACKQFKIPPLQGNIDIFFQSQTPLKATSTLLQNRISQNSILTIKIRDKSLLNKESQHRKDFQIKKQVLEGGLSIKYYCKNSKCVNYMRDSMRNLGYGQFDIGNQVKKLHCEVCPYKSQNIHVSTGYRNAIVRRCVFKIRAIEHVQELIFRQREGQWTKCEEQKIISKKLEIRKKEIGKIIIVKMI